MRVRGDPRPSTETAPWCPSQTQGTQAPRAACTRRTQASEAACTRTQVSGEGGGSGFTLPLMLTPDHVPRCILGLSQSSHWARPLHAPHLLPPPACLAPPQGR